MINFETYNQSLNLIFGIDPFLPAEEYESFNPLDNDYIRIALYERDSTQKAIDRNGKPNTVYTYPDLELERCS